MASVCSPSAPCSLQLRLVRCSLGSSPPIDRLAIHFPPFRRRKSFAVSASESSDGDSALSHSSTGPREPTDPFSGWNASDVDAPDQSNKKNAGGFLGARLAAVLFAAGVSFTVLALRGRRSSGSKIQLQPLASEQELVTIPDDPVDVHQVSHAGETKNDNIEHACYNISENEKGTIKDLSHGENDGGCNGSTNSESSIPFQDPINQDLVNGSLVYDSFDATLPENVVKMDDNGASSSESFGQAPDISSEVLDLKSLNYQTSSNDMDSSVYPDGNLSIASYSDLVTKRMSNGSADQQAMLLETSMSEVPEAENPDPSKRASFDTMAVNSDDIVNTLGFSKDIANSGGHVPIDPNIFNNGIESATNQTSSVASSCPIQSLPVDTENNFDGYAAEDGALPFNETVNVKLDLNTIRATNTLLNLQDVGPENLSLLKENLLGVAVDSEQPSVGPGIPAPSVLFPALKTTPGQVKIPAMVDPSQGQAFTALQVLKVIEVDAQPGEICTRREYARWLVAASSLSKNTILKVYPAMFIENLTQLAFDDITPDDPDFSSIQGLAEAGLIHSKLSQADLIDSTDVQQASFFFFPDSPVSRQDLLSWKMAFEKRQLPETNKKQLYQLSGYIDIDRINSGAWPALAADLAAGDQSIASLAFGYTRLFQPEKPITKAQAAIALTVGDAAEVVNEELVRIEAETLAEAAVTAHTALVAQVEDDLNASFEKELAKEREKIQALEILAEEAKMELVRLKMEREEENSALVKGQAVVDSEMEVLSKLRLQMEEQLHGLITSKLELSFEKERIENLRKEAENENLLILQLKYEVEVERKALSMARTWAEEEAKRVREHSRALEEARAHWQLQGIKVVADEDLQEAASSGATWLSVGEESLMDQTTITRGEKLVDKLRAMRGEMKVRSSAVIDKIIRMLASLIRVLKQRAQGASEHCKVLWTMTKSRAQTLVSEAQDNAVAFGANIGERASKAVEDFRDGMDKITQKFKT